MNVLLRLCAALGLCVVGCDRPPHGDATVNGGGQPVAPPATQPTGVDVGRVTRSDAEWKQILSPERYRVLRQKWTETPFANALNGNHDKGVYACAGCDLDLYSSDVKFESGTGWPSFWAPIAPGHVLVSKDYSHGMERDEVLCPRCGGHLGHVFNDGPKPTGLRYCMNSAAMTFKKK